MSRRCTKRLGLGIALILRTTFFTNTLCSERRFIQRYWKAQASDNGRGLFDWYAFQEDIHTDPNSTECCKDYADVLVSAIEDGEYDADVYAEWHHLVPLCIFGSVELDENYVRIRPALHVKVHAVLAYFFPSCSPLQRAVTNLINTRTSIPAVAVLLNDDAWFETIGLARERSRAAHSKFMTGKKYALKPASSDPAVQVKRDGSNRTNARQRLREEGLPIPPELKERRVGRKCKAVVTKKIEKDRLCAQRRRFKKKNGVPLAPPGSAFTTKELNMWNAAHPDDPLQFF
jgi:hypothetical protein